MNGFVNLWRFLFGFLPVTFQVAIGGLIAVALVVVLIKFIGHFIG